METLAYLHSASACEEMPPIEAVFGEDDAMLFDGVVNWQKFSSVALLGLAPLAVASFAIIGNPSAAQAGGWEHGGHWGHGGGWGHHGHHHPQLVKKVVIEKIVFKKIVFKKFRKVVYFYRPRHHHYPVYFNPCHRHYD